MGDKYCYPNSTVLINKKNIQNAKEFLKAEIHYTAYRLYALQNSEVKGKFDFKHLCKIHKDIFQDLFTWAGKTRDCNISKGGTNFCQLNALYDYGNSIFEDFYPSCLSVKDNPELFVKTVAKNYADLNSLHPFREGNGRTQREFTRELCLKCGYIFDLSVTTHQEMLDASKLALEEVDLSLLIDIFNKAIIPIEKYQEKDEEYLKVLTSDDLFVEDNLDDYEYYYDN
ncbi:MAG: Fic family protein [Lachnospiraceae bacterium]|nr:Fic family protein [Lachnospiraceae bacterium]